jgi:hypothetical protein
LIQQFTPWARSIGGITTLETKKAFFAVTRDTEVIDTGLGHICYNLAIMLPGRKLLIGSDQGN